MNGFVSEDCHQVDIYINTYSQKVSGDDQNFVVQTGQSIDSVVALELVDFRMINFLTNFDKGFNEDFSDFSIIINGQKYVIKATQYYQSVSNFFAWFNTQLPDGLTCSFQIDSVLNYLINNLQFTNENQVQQFTLLGPGWTKLGFNIGTSQNQLNAILPFDLSQSCMINIYINAVPSGIICSQGAITFTVVNNSSFGGIINWQADSSAQNSAKKVVFQQPITIPSLLTIQFQNEEQQPLTSVQGRNSAVNQAGVESIMVLKCWIKK